MKNVIEENRVIKALEIGMKEGERENSKQLTMAADKNIKTKVRKLENSRQLHNGW